MNETNATKSDLVSAISQKLQNGSEDVDSNEMIYTKSFIDFHNHNSFIAVIIIMSLFLVVTISTTGFVLAFCRKKNTVFALQKCEQESEYELDDMDNTDTETCDDDNSTPKKTPRSRTFPSFTQIKSDEFPSSPSRTPLVNNSNQFYSSNNDDTLLLSDTFESNGMIRKIHRSHTIGIFPIVDSSKQRSDIHLDNMFTTTALINGERTTSAEISISMEDNLDHYNISEGTLEFLDINSIAKDQDGEYINV